MCGIVGIWCRGEPNSARQQAHKMCCSIRHRGPDDHGVFADEALGLAIGNRRLAIQDLSNAGHQPMRSDDGRICLSYNGEVYNFKEIRRGLVDRGHRFKTASDTEVVLRSYEEWGTDCLQRFRGMFGIAIWEADDRKLILVRDRLGVKPLHYFWDGRRLLFASELKALCATSLFPRRLNLSALNSFLSYGFIGAEETIFADTYKVLPGHFVELKDGALTKSRYWQARDYFIRDEDRPQLTPKAEANLLVQTEELLTEAASLRLVSDVPVGVFLSGGVDSSLVTALLAKAVPELQTFTMSVTEPAYDEGEWGAAVARQLGTRHHTFSCSPTQLTAVLREQASVFDEPFADTSSLPTLLLARAASEHVKVVLSADGGDELCAGYPHYAAAARLDTARKVIGQFGFRQLSRVLSILSPQTVDEVSETILPRSFHTGRRFRKLRSALLSNSSLEIFKKSREVLTGDEKRRIGVLPDTGATSGSRADCELDPLDSMMLLDIGSYLPDDILVKVDRTTMACSIEAREPLLDHLVVQHFAALPPSLKRRNGQSKYMLKRVLEKYLPKHLVHRPKRGFSVPMHRWGRTTLKPVFTEYLSADRLSAGGLFDHAAIQSAFGEYVRGNEQLGDLLWPIVVFEMWRERWM